MYFKERLTRLADEIAGLEQLCELNPSILGIEKIARGTIEFTALVSIELTPAPFLRSRRIDWISHHRLRIEWQRLFPAIPVEFYMERPPLHPNVGPEDGFVCLWEDFRPERTAAEGIVALRNILTWQTFNPLQAHLMQEKALGMAEEIQAARPERLARLVLPGSSVAARRGLRRFDVLD